MPTSRWLTMHYRSRVQHLDRVLDRDDVLLPRPVDVVDHRRERRRLARAGRAGDEDEPAVLLGEAPHAGRQVKRLERRDLARDDTADERDRAALPERVDAEARLTGPRSRCRARRSTSKARWRSGVGPGHRCDDRVEVLLGQRRLPVERLDQRRRRG